MLNGVTQRNRGWKVSMKREGERERGAVALESMAIYYLRSRAQQHWWMSASACLAIQYNRARYIFHAFAFLCSCYRLRIHYTPLTIPTPCINFDLTILFFNH